MIAIGCLVVIIIIIAFVGMRARDLEHRMDIVANERRGLSTTATNLTGAKTEQSELIKKIVDSLNLRSHIGIGKAKPLLISAGFRGMQAEITFMFARLACCILFFVLTLFYIFFVGMWDIPRIMAVVIALFAGFAGLWAPHVWVQNLVQKRQVEIKKAWPDCLDLMLICVDAGMSVEQAFRRVADEIGPQSVALAEEFALSTAELSYLPNRRMAYDNLGKRIGLEIARNLGLALIQAEKYGTPVGNTLRVLAQESRDMRIMEAERKAAALAVKLTIPAMIFFFLPIFVIIFVPVVIQALDQGLI
jgi:tight adherence protein C